MNFLQRAGILSLCLLALFLKAQPSPFTVADSIAMVRFSDPDASEHESDVHASPDGKHFAFVTSRGLLATNHTESSLWAFDTDVVESWLHGNRSGAPPKARLIARVSEVPQILSNTAYQSMIVELQWAQDSKRLYYVAQDNLGMRRLKVFDLATGEARELSPPGYDVFRYVTNGDATLYSSLRKPQLSVTPGVRINEDALNITGVALRDVLVQDPMFSPVVEETWYRRDALATPRRLGGDEHPELFVPDSFDHALTLSPKGGYAVFLARVGSPHKDWHRYEPALGQEHLRIDPASTGRDPTKQLFQYVLADLVRGTTKTLIDAPIGRQLGYFDRAQAVWADDETSVIVTNTFLSMEDRQAGGHVSGNAPCAALVYNVVSGTQQCLLFKESTSSGVSAWTVVRASFGRSSSQLSLQLRNGTGSVRNRTYVRTASAWEVQPEASPSAAYSSPERSTLELTIRQDLNTPPTLWARDRVTNQEGEVWDPNPSFQTKALGAVKSYHWLDAQGHDWSGGLVTPPDAPPPGGYPLVIQIYQFKNDEFMTDGLFPTAMAARALAGVGIAYLQVSKKPHTWNREELDEQLAGITSAIDSLAAKGVINANKVGLIGFSASCPYVEYALIQEPGRFAAATIADGIDNSYMQEMLWGVSDEPIRAQFNRINGGAPYGDGFAHWKEMALDFHLDRVRSPIRIEAIRPLSLLSEWELYSSLSQQGKTVDFIYIPEGQHILQKPWDRMASQQGNVDWFRHWLQGVPLPTREEPN